MNDGAKKAIIEKNKSLLSIGITAVNGSFDRGDVISIVDESNNEFARGIANYNSQDCIKILGLHSDNIYEVLGHKNYDAVITKDNIALI